MSNTTFVGPVRSTDGFLEKDESGNWVPVSGGGNSLSFSGSLTDGTWNGGSPVQIGLKPSGVTPGTYINPTITVNAVGLITSATNGTPPPPPADGVKNLFTECQIFGDPGPYYFDRPLPAYALITSIDVTVLDQFQGYFYIGFSGPPSASRDIALDYPNPGKYNVYSSTNSQVYPYGGTLPINPSPSVIEIGSTGGGGFPAFSIVRLSINYVIVGP